MSTIKSLPDPIINCNNKDVYHPSDDSYLIIDYLKNHVNEKYFDDIDIKNINKILDLGTGTGIIAIFLHLLQKVNLNFKAEIYGSDISKEAIECAKHNAKANNLGDKIKFFISNLFQSFPNSLKHSFDIIIFNPPYLPSLGENKSKELIDLSWNGGKEGYEIIIQFLDTAKNFLNTNHNCYIYFISSSKTDLGKLNELLKQRGLNQQILKKKHLFFEDILLNRINFTKF
ncbi:MAG: methyltransferase domain-containing protein [Promethearchaeota archaeon]|nr:MAG: methyltransferase domain-containing protein [Candidatus Lokiarchaeota archaeon]